MIRLNQRSRAVLDTKALGIGFLACVTVGLSDHTKDARQGFERAMARFSEVRECHNTIATVEYLLRVEAADLPAYKQLHTEKLGTLPQVRQITTHVVAGSPEDARV